VVDATAISDAIEPFKKSEFVSQLAEPPEAARLSDAVGHGESVCVLLFEREQTWCQLRSTSASDPERYLRAGQ
jgi:hypothetical protein